LGARKRGSRDWGREERESEGGARTKKTPLKKIDVERIAGKRGSRARSYCSVKISARKEPLTANKMSNEGKGGPKSPEIWGEEDKGRSWKCVREGGVKGDQKGAAGDLEGK